MKYTHSKSAYSLIIALFVMSFLLVLTTGMFRLVLSELLQNRWEEWYLQAFAWAESSRELALLHIKKNGYESYDNIPHEISNKSILLSDSMDMGDFSAQKDVFISYDLWSRADTYEWKIGKFKYDIIPLYSNDIHLQDVSLDVTQWNSEELLWNIVGLKSGLAGFGEFNKNTPGKSRRLSDRVILFDTPSIGEFLQDGDQNYLIVFNAGKNDITYTLKSSKWNYFTLPRSYIISSAQIWKYRQNLQTYFDNTEFLWILRYSIFSPKTGE